MIKDYRVVNAGSIHDLEMLVDAKLKEGYELHGAPFAWAGICQAVILIEYTTLQFELRNELVGERPLGSPEEIITAVTSPAFDEALMNVGPA